MTRSVQAKKLATLATVAKVRANQARQDERMFESRDYDAFSVALKEAASEIEALRFTIDNSPHQYLECERVGLYCTCWKSEAP